MAVTKETSDGTTTINFNVNLNRTMVILSPFILSAVFIILKFTGIVSWSLLTVLSPLWVVLAFYLLLIGLVLLNNDSLDNQGAVPFKASSTQVRLALASLTGIFTVMKLIGLIAWSWVWVLSPLWVGIALHLSFMAVFYVGAFIYFMRKG